MTSSSSMHRCAKRLLDRVEPHFPEQLVVPRPKFEGVWARLAGLTVLAAAPGWGKTMWMRQAAQAVGEENVTWVRSAEQLYQLQEFGEGAGPQQLNANSVQPHVVFVDGFEDCLAWDPSLWVALEQLAQTPGVSVVVSSYDAPPENVPDAVVLTEHNLALDPAERQALAAKAKGKGSSADMFSFQSDARGCPWLFGREARKYLVETDEWEWVAAEHTPDVTFYEKFPHHLGFADSEIGKAFQYAHGLPRFTEASLQRLVPAADAATLFERLKAWPVFEETVDEESGEDALRWTRKAFRAARQAPGFPQDNRVLLKALEVEEDRGSAVGKLWVLLTLGDLEQAERFAETHLRHLLMFAEPNLEEALQAAVPDPSRHPALSLLNGELRRRKAGDEESVKADARTAARVLAARVSQTMEEELAKAARVAFAAVSAGDRKYAHRFLGHALELVEIAQANWTTMGTDAKRMVTSSLYLAYWAAIQLDDHGAARLLADFVAATIDPGDRIAPMEKVAAATQADLDGDQSSVEQGEGVFPSSAASLRDLDEGDDALAVERFRPLADLDGVRPSRSALDGLELIVNALAGPSSFGSASVDEAVERSARLWGDQGSSFVAWAALVAYSTVYDGRPAARHAAISDGADTFGLLSQVTRSQWQGQHAEALRRLEVLLQSDLPPRFAMLVRVLQAASLSLTGNDALARKVLINALYSKTDARLMRFAFRFIPEGVAENLIGLLQEGSQFQAQTARGFANDRRRVVWSDNISLTPAEVEILRLLSLGMSNEAIAEARFVVVGTVRNQLKTIYRKLGVSSRVEAVKAAYQLGVFERP